MLAVWVPQFPGDERSKWDPELLDDKRVVHFWNEDSSAGVWFHDHVDLPYDTGPVLWDAYLLYGPRARWESVPDGLISTGATLIGSSDQLGADLGPLLRRSG